jgi:hypothetical protein
MTASERRAAIGALALAVLFASGTARNANELEDRAERQQWQIDQLDRQVAQLNGRVFLGVDIPDTESGRR